VSETNAELAAPSARGLRQGVRDALTRQIVVTANEMLAQHGAGQLSVRAVARSLGMASSAIYRYVPSRDALITLLIVEAYNSLGDHVESSHTELGPASVGERWRTIGRATRAWALDQPHRYALIYGSPVPGYAAPEITIEPATRLPRLMIGLLADQAVELPEPGRAVPGELAERFRLALGPLRAMVPASVPDELVLRALMGWTQLFGVISFELFGHLRNVISDDPELRRELFDLEMDRVSAWIGLSHD
jgi:AcrR family transcriptional regulator